MKTEIDLDKLPDGCKSHLLAEAEEGLTADYPNRKSPQSKDCGLSHIHQLAAFMLKAQGPSEE